MASKVGTASKGAFAAIWGEEMPYINVYWIGDFKCHRKALMQAAAVGECPEYPIGVHAIVAMGGVDPDAYVEAELERFVAEDGQAYIDNR